ncbi:hypothetical protein ACLB2K_050478 [Fragaria x ananassa]
MVGIIDDPTDPGTQAEELSQPSGSSLPGDSSLTQTSDAAPISHPDPTTALEILKRDFHSFREQAAKEKAEAKACRVRIVELEKEQSLLRATLEHRNVYNNSQTGSMLPERPSHIIYVSHPLTHPSLPLPAPQPSPIPNNSPNPPFDMPTRQAVTQLTSRTESITAREARDPCSLDVNIAHIPSHLEGPSSPPRNIILAM